MPEHAAKIWYIPDAYLATPEDDDPVYKNHEAICVINATFDEAELHFDFYFADRDPIEDVLITIPGKRCVHIRMDDPAQIGGTQIPLDTPYGVRIRSSIPVVVQYSRMYATARPISVLTTMAYPVPLGPEAPE